MNILNKTTFTFTMEEEDIEFIVIALKDMNRVHEESKADPKMLEKFDDWIESCDSCIEQNNSIIEQLEAVVGYKY